MVLSANPEDLLSFLQSAGFTMAKPLSLQLDGMVLEVRKQVNTKPSGNTKKVMDRRPKAKEKIARSLGYDVDI